MRRSDGGCVFASVSASEPEGSRSKARSGPRAFRLAFRLALSCAIFCAAPARAQDFFQNLFGWGQQHSAPRVIERRGAAGQAEEEERREDAAGRQAAAGRSRATPPPAAEGPPPPYEPQLLRLSEILGALSYLRDLCGAGGWRGLARQNDLAARGGGQERASGGSS